MARLEKTGEEVAVKQVRKREQGGGIQEEDS